jgi:PAS domain S-box-containing protein
MELAAAAKLSSYAHEPRTRTVELRAAQVRQIYSQSVPALIGAQLSAVVFVIALWNVVAHWLLLAWLAVYFALQLVRNSIVRAFNRTAPSDEHAAIWGTRFSVITIAAGLTWGMAGVFLFPATAIAHQVIVAVFLSGISAAAMAAYFPLKQCYVPTIMAECLPLAFRCFYELDQVHFIMGSVMVLYCAVLILTGNRVHALLGETLRLGFEKNDLVSSVLEQQNELRTLNHELTEQIEERTRAEQTLTENEARYRELAELLPQLIFELDLEGKFRFVNRAGLEMMGRTVADVSRGLFPIEVCGPPDRDKVRLHVDAALSGKVISGAECDLTRNDGTTVPVIIYATPIVLDGTIKGVRAVGVDVSDLKAAQEKLLASLKEKELLLREIHHRVKNNLQVVCSLLRVQRRRIGDQQFAAMFQESEDRIASMAAVYEKLYQSDNLAELNARDYLTSVVRYIRGTYESVGKAPDLRTDLQDLTLAPDSAIPLGLIATELISNSLKHAFPDPATGQVNVVLRPLSTGRVELVVSDNGSGLPEHVGPDDCTSLGLRLVRIFTNQLGGEIRITRNGGTSISVQFDRPEAERGREA